MNKGAFLRRSFHITHISLNPPRIINLSGKSCRKNHETLFVLSNFFSPENRTFYEKFCRTGQATNDNIIRRLRFACWLIANIKHSKPSNFSSQPLPVYNQPFHTFSHVEGNNLLVMYASTMNPYHLKVTKIQPLAVDTGMVPRTTGQEPAIRNPSLSPPTPNQYGQYSQRQAGASSSTDRDFTVHTPSPSLSVTSNHTDCSFDFKCV